MRYRMTFLIGFGAGYVLGARAGRARYEQIVRRWRSFLGKPEVQHAAETARHEAGDLLGTARRVVTETFAGKDVTDQVHTGPGTSVRV